MFTYLNIVWFFLTDLLIGKLKQPTVTICTLREDEYQKQLFQNGDRLISSIFPDLQLTAPKIFAVGRYAAM